MDAQDKATPQSEPIEHSDRTKLWIACALVYLCLVELLLDLPMRAMI